MTTSTHIAGKVGNNGTLRSVSEIGMLRRYFFRARKFVVSLSGKSYHHVDQSPGKCYVAGRLEGYFNNLTGKADWPGVTTEHGVPLISTDTSGPFGFPITIFQWALGHWDLWLLSGRKNETHRRLFLAGADWAVANLTPEGGWDTWTGLQRPVISKFSAMSQGEGLSVLVRADSIEPRSEYRDAARRAFEFLVRPEDNPLLAPWKGHLLPQEYPGNTYHSVLNGGIFAIVGVKDYALATGDAAANQWSENLVSNLVMTLPNYDSGYWSWYDLSGHLASPFYHKLHIAQLEVLAIMYPQHAAAIEPVLTSFRRHQAKLGRRTKALFVKIAQKLKDTDLGEMTD